MTEFLNILKNRTVNRWIASYVIILLIPTMIIGYVLFVKNSVLANEQFVSINCDKAEKMSQLIDDRMMEFKKVGVQLSLSSLVKKFMNGYRTNISQYDYDGYLNLMGELKNYLSTNGLIADISIIFPYTETVLSVYGQDSFDDFFEYNNRFSGDGAERIIRETSVYNHFKVLDAEDVSVFNKRYHVIPVIQSLHFTSGKPKASLLILIDTYALGKFIDGVKTDPQSDFVFSRGNGWLAFGENGRIVGDFPSDAAFTDVPGVEGLKKFGEYFLHTVPSKVTGWKYTYVFPQGLANLKIRDIGSTILISAFLAFLLGFIVSAMFVFRNYNPVYRLFKNAVTLSPVQAAPIQAGKKVSEFEVIENSLHNLVVVNQSMEEQINEYRPIMRKNLLNQLVKGFFQSDSEIEKALKGIGFHYEGNLLFGVFVIGLGDLNSRDEDLSETAEATDHTDEYAVYRTMVVLENYLKEQGADARVFDNEWGRITVIVCLKDADIAAAQEVMVRLVSGMKETGGEILKRHLYIASGGVSSSIPGVSKAYIKADKMAEWMTITGDDHATLGSYVQTGSSFYFYPNDWEVQLINSLKSGNFNVTSRIIHEIKFENCVNRSLDLEILRRLIVEIIETGMKVIDELNMHALKDEVEYKKVSRSKSVAELWNYIDRFFSGICREVLSLREKSKPALANQVIEYVEENCFGNYLSLKELSEKFNLHSSTISKMFKESTGSNFLDYINRKRIQKAKELLKSTNEEIYSIAQAVGYDNYTTFSRLFSKYEGISPAEYRKAII